ncbi:hypothetical protein DM01DRAFT_1350220 [Hesseltinella vesiculosa]|uniref:Transcription initiation factor TFIID subunit 2 n=1 Tax=Hesseltinella vesiculosa TaxID=101127 RepID=A0A1X2G2B0_9FUNG|nr:hypothetical protein DM01DRAFT_1350220 [Hesseltinella vesiculosa]
MHLDIVKVLVNEVPVHYDLADPVSCLTLGNATTIAHHQVYKSKYLAALRDSDEGELSIRIPESCIKKLTASEAQLMSSQIYLETQQLGDGDQQSKPEAEKPAYAPITIRIDFKLEDPRAGIVFVEPEEDVAPYRAHHVYTVNQPLPGATRAWLPCIDNICERCTWDMEFVVPRRMGQSLLEVDNDTAYDEDATVVVCSGEMIEQVIHPKDPSKKIVHYNLSVPTSAPFIGFAIGPFEMIKLSPSQLQEEVLNASELDESQQQSLMAEINMMSNIYAFALPGYQEELNVSCTFLMHAMHFFAQEYGSYPFSDFKVVFVDVAWSDTAASASLTICSSRLLHDSTVIEQTYDTRHALSLALARQWFGVHIIQKTWMDTWLILGLANLMGALFIKRHLGNNEYRLRLKKDMDACCALDVNRPPLYNPALPSPLDPEDLSFMGLKAPLVLFILDRRMCKAGTTLGLSRVIPKILVSAMSGELPQNAISTHYFMRLCRKISGFDTKSFAEQWVYKSGCPRFTFSFNFNRKKMVVELYMKQDNTNTVLANKNRSHAAASVDGISSYQDFVTPLFTGNFTVRIHEADGTPYEHVLDIQSHEHKFEVQFNTKYKRIRRNTKRFQAKQAAAAAAVAEEEQEQQDEANQGEPGTVLGIIPTLGLGMPMFEDPAQKEKWRVSEWGQDNEDASGAASAIFDWIRLDAEFEWLTCFDFEQPDYMWAAQLTKDRDVVAQHQAIQALQRMPSLQTSTSLLRALMDPKCFYKIRMESAYALAACAKPSLHWVGLLQLGKMFKKRYCFASATQDMDLSDDLPFEMAIPKPNNFSNLQDYFIQKAVIIALSRTRDDNGLTPVKIRQFLLDLLRYNDNLGNEFSDCYYIATMISSLGDSLIPTSNVSEALERESPEGWALIETVKAEIERFRTLDYVIPTYHNVVTVACLKAMTKLMLHGLMDLDLSMFLPYTRYGNYLEVRLTALDSLLVLAGLGNHEVTNYFIDIIKEDPSVFVSHYLSKAFLAWLGLALKDGNNLTMTKAAEEFAEEEGQTLIQEEQNRLAKTAYQDFQINVKALRERFEKDVDLQRNLWDLLNSPENIITVDHSVRKYLLQFCEYMFKPIDAGLKVTIRVPTVPHDIAEDVSEPPSPAFQPVIRIGKPKLPKEKKGLNEANEPKPANTSIIRSFVSESHGMASQVSSPASTASSAASPAPLSPPHVPSPPRELSPPHVPSSPVKQMAPSPMEVVPPSPSPPPPPAPKSAPPKQPKLVKSGPVSAPHSRTDKDICIALLYKVMESRHAFEFLRPVDPIKQGIPHYFQVIKHPMDLGTIKAKLKNSQYLTVQQFDDDIRLMLNNCYNFNPPNTYVYNEAKSLEQVYDKEYSTHFGSPTKAAAMQPTVPTPTAAAAPVASSPTKKVSISLASSPAPPTAPLPSVAKPAAPIKHAKVVKPPQAPSPAVTKASASGPVISVMDDDNKDICGRILTELWNQPEALPFHYPIDVVALNIPTYLDFIKRPMDFSTVRDSLMQGNFATIWDFEKDVRQIFWNCFRFNDPSSLIHQQAMSVQDHFNQLWHRAYAEPDCLTGEDDMLAKKLMSTLMKREDAQLFMEPVDTTILTDYAAVIKQPMDLRTIKEKLYSGRYSSLGQFDADFRLMISNCSKYNHPKSFACEQAKRLDHYYLRGSQGKELRARIQTLSGATNSSSNLSGSSGTYTNTALSSSVSSNSKPPVSVPITKPTTPTPMAKPVTLSKPSPKPASPKPPSSPMNNNRAPTSASKPSPVTKQALPTPSPSRPPMPSTAVAGGTSAMTAQGNVAISVPLSTAPARMTTTPQTAATASSAVSSSLSRPTAEPPTNKLLPGLHTRLEVLLSKLKRHKNSLAFLYPVDPVALGIPHYSTIVTHPMDLGTMSKTLKSGGYKMLKDFEADFKLIVQNCILFNGPEHIVSQYAKELDVIFNKDIQVIREKERQILAGQLASAGATKPKVAAPRRPTGSTMRADIKKYKPILDKLRQKEYYVAFAAPVDPIALQIPTYYDYVKHPMDLGTVLSKLERYQSANELLDDVKQVVVNCYLFNLPDDIVCRWGHSLESDFNQMCRERGLAGILINMDSERRKAEAEGATLQDISYYTNVPYFTTDAPAAPVMNDTYSQFDSISLGKHSIDEDSQDLEQYDGKKMKQEPFPPF